MSPARVWKTWKSVRASQGGSMAALKECTKGCMSVEEMSCFSYQVAAGRTTSECRVVEVLRKSAVHMRSSLPTGASSRQVTEAGRCSAGASTALTSLSAPTMWRRKNSVPLAELPSRFVRHEHRMRGKFSGASGSSQAKRSSPERSCSTM